MLFYYIRFICTDLKCITIIPSIFKNSSTINHLQNYKIGFQYLVCYISLHLSKQSYRQCINHVLRLWKVFGMIFSDRNFPEALLFNEFPVLNGN